MNTPIGRDFKRTSRRSGVQLGVSRDFFVGLGIGLAIALGVFLWQSRALKAAEAAVESLARPEPRAATKSDAVDETEEARNYDFYDMLPSQEVVVPEAGKEAPVEPLPNSPIARPGNYVLQLGAYRELAEAERLQTKLSRLGISASLQRIAIDNDVFHRVRIGPVSDLESLNRTRARLRAADIDMVVIRVSD
jgi:cell division protein FtsN